MRPLYEQLELQEELVYTAFSLQVERLAAERLSAGEPMIAGSLLSRALLGPLASCAWARPRTR